MMMMKRKGRALNFTDEMYFGNGLLESGRKSSGNSVVRSAVVAVLAGLGTFWLLRMFDIEAVGPFMAAVVVAMVCWIVKDIVVYEDYGHYLFFDTLFRMVAYACLLIGLLPFIAGVNYAMIDSDDVISLQLLVTGVLLIANVVLAVAGWVLKSGGYDGMPPVWLVNVAFFVAWVAFGIHDLRFIDVGNSCMHWAGYLINAVLLNQLVLFCGYCLFGMIIIDGFGAKLLNGWCALRYSEDVRKKMDIPSIRWYYSDKLRRKYGASELDATIEEKLEKIGQADDYTCFSNGISEMDLRGRRILEGFEVDSDSSGALYLLCTEEGICIVREDGDRIFGSVNTDLPYDRISWYRRSGLDDDELSISDGGLVLWCTLHDDDRARKLAFILKNHDVPEYADETVECETEIPEWVPGEYVDGYRAAVAGFEEGEHEEVIDDVCDVDRETMVCDEEALLMVTDRRIYVILNKSVTGIPYVSVRKQGLRVHKNVSRSERKTEYGDYGLFDGMIMMNIYLDSENPFTGCIEGLCGDDGVERGYGGDADSDDYDYLDDNDV